jgi:hypothetical protein
MAVLACRRRYADARFWPQLTADWGDAASRQLYEVHRS